MATITVLQPKRTELYYHRQLQALECMGCMEMIEVPKFGVLRAGGLREPIRNHPENLMRWRELQELDHSACSSYGSVLEAQQARKFRKERDRRKLVGTVRTIR